MTRTRPALLLPAAALLALTACVPAPGADPAPDDSCNASALQDLVGQPASVLDRMRFAVPVRVMQPGMAYTMEYRADRVSIGIGESGRIERVACG